MATLTLTPERCGATDGFEEGSYAYAFADRPVRKSGVLLTATPMHVRADGTGVIEFELTPSDEADDKEEFSYTVAAFDPTGRRMWIHNIVMPNDDTLIYDLVDETVDLDAHVHVPTVCGPVDTSDDSNLPPLPSDG